MLNRLLIVLAGLLMMCEASADVLGEWVTIDDETDKPKSVVQIYEKGGKYYGRVVDLLLKPDDTLCKECEGELHNKPVVGMVILNNMVLEDEEYVDGTILDPANGKTYRCKFWLEDGVLQVRGYLGFFFRTQQWYRKGEVPDDL